MRKMSLTAMAREHPTAARSASSGRSAKTVFGGHEQVLRQTVIALTSGRVLEEHDNPGEATLYVLQGRVRLATTDAAWDGSPGWPSHPDWESTQAAVMRSAGGGPPVGDCIHQRDGHRSALR